MPRKNKKIYFADFETTQINEFGVVSVYLWVILSGDEIHKGYDIDSFFSKIKELSAIIYFHNLKFDFSYIHYFALKNNIECNILEKKGTYYSVKIFDVEFRDTMNFFPNMTVKSIGENYCEKYKKTSIDLIVQQGHIAQEIEIDYCINDCRVVEEGFYNYMNAVADVLKNACATKTLSTLHKKLTNAGIAFEAFKELSDFDSMCPKTTISEYNAFKGAYKGGYVYSAPRGVVEDVLMIDCNSIYPAVYSTEPMPVGKPIKSTSFKELENYKFYIVNINICYDLKEDYIPIIGGGVGKFGGTLYKSSSLGEYENITVCNVDLELIKRYYDCEINLIWGCGFDTKPHFFKKFTDTFIEMKNKETGAKRNVAKVLLNSPYGKTAMNGINEIKSYYIDEEAQIVKSNIIGYECDESVFQYIPIAVAITSYARRLLLETAEKIGFENIHYMDTDSIKFNKKADISDIEIDPNKLGAWKDEGTATLYKTIAPKKYVYYDGDKIHYTCAGFSKATLNNEMKHDTCISYDEAIELMNLFDKGLELNCLQSKKTTGGRALINVRKMIN